MMLFPMEVLPRGVGEDMGPKSRAWVELAHSRPAYKVALEKGGKYAYAEL
jgi:glutathione S-transferase